MRKVLLFAIIIACSLAASAYVPLVREGVKWVNLYRFADYQYEYDGQNWRPTDKITYNQYYYYELKGDTIIDGKTYKKLYQVLLTENNELPQSSDAIQFSSKTDSYAYLNETDGVVMMYVDSDNPAIINDLETKIGQEWIVDDNNHIRIYDFQDPFPNIVTQGEDLMIDGMMCKSYLYNNTDVCLVESVGFVGSYNVCGGDLVSPFAWGTERLLSHVVDNDGHIIFKGPHYEATSDVNNDGSTDGADLNILINLVLGKDNDDWHLIRGNVDGEDLIDGADINEVINFILKK